MTRRSRPPRLVRLEDRLAPAIAEFLDPNPAPGNRFGDSVLALSTGNVVITSPFDDAGGADAGAVYLFNGRTGELISTLRGSQPGDRIGSGGYRGRSPGGIYYSADGLRALGNGNFLVISPFWSNNGAANAGAVTFGSGVTGVSGTITPFNSLVGAHTDDLVGAYYYDDGFQSYGVYTTVTVLTNGNYAVISTQWDRGTLADAGAVTFGSGVTGVTGVITAGNSLVGSTPGDEVGNGGVTPLAGGGYVVGSPYWSGPLEPYVGAATFGGTAGVTGPVSESNSLVGTTAYDFVGERVEPLAGGNYLVCSPSWTSRSGAVTFGSGTAGVSGPVSELNSLVGSVTEDDVGGYGSIVRLANGNYVVRSPYWDNGGFVNAGAVTFGSGAAGVSGFVSPANSLVGGAKNDYVGFRDVVPLANGNYVVLSPYWDNGLVVDAGAATLGSGTAGVTGVAGPGNSLVGSSKDDQVGNYVVKLAGGDYLIPNSYWDNGPAVNAGAVTFCSATAGVVGPVSAANSLVGATAGDSVGGAAALANGNYVVFGPYWDNGAEADVGIVTLCSGMAGAAGVINPANSLIGATAGDAIGSHGGVTALANGNYVVSSRDWQNAGVVGAGAVTFGNGTTGVVGVVSPANSLVGTQKYDQVGLQRAVALPNGNYVVISLSWNNGPARYAGAATFGSGTTGVTGPVSAANSLVGTQPYDYVGYNITPLANGNFVIGSPGWHNGGAASAGAVTFASGTTGVSGEVSAANSLVGTSTYDTVGSPGYLNVTTVVALPNGNYVLDSPYWDSGTATKDAGAVTFGRGTAGVAGTVTAANSLIGGTAYTGLRTGPILDAVNGTFIARFVTEGGGRVRVGSQVYGFTPPKITSVVVNGGEAQRSRVTSVKVTFDQLVVLPANPAGAFRLTRQSDGATPGLSAAVDDTGPGTVVTLTFTGGVAVDAGSLADGRYTLTVLKAGVNAGHFDGNGDGIAGDDYTTTVHRLFGDADGDGDVDAVDFGAFRSPFGSTNLSFDSDNDGDVDAVDFGAFRQRFGQTV